MNHEEILAMCASDNKVISYMKVLNLKLKKSLRISLIRISLKIITFVTVANLLRLIFLSKRILIPRVATKSVTGYLEVKKFIQK